MKPVLTKVTEVEGIFFETWISEPVLIIPPKEVDAYTPVEWGISVANNSPHSYRFVFFHLVPEIIKVNGEKIKLDYGSNATCSPYGCDFMLLKPGERVSSVVNGKLYWLLEQQIPKDSGNRLLAQETLRIQGRNRFGGIWSFWNLSPDTYFVRFLYEKRVAREKLRGTNEIVEDIWVGKALTPWAEFSLVLPPI